MYGTCWQDTARHETRVRSRASGLRPTLWHFSMPHSPKA